MTNIFYILSRKLYIFLFRISEIGELITFSRWCGKFCFSNSSNIHGYLLTYPWIFHYVSADISLRIHGYASFSVLKTCFSDKYFVLLGSNRCD